MPTTNQYDAIVIGGGHNGRVTGAYSARAGLFQSFGVLIEDDSAQFFRPAN
jgi:tRNA U34 5-carboxymethylaminomethyl modifying enzyme MnmG/GidA